MSVFVQVVLALVTGVVAGVVAAAIWAVCDDRRRQQRNRKNFDPIAGRYSIAPKLATQSDLGSGKTAIVTVARNVLNITFQGLPGGDLITGEIAMSEEFPRSGEGHYRHLKGGQQLWGFWKLQVQDVSTLLVHHEYARHDARLITQGFLWKRQPSEKEPGAV